MAQRHPSALKRNRQNLKRRARNRHVRSEVRTDARKLREAIERSDLTAAEQELRTVVKALTKAATKGVLHRNAASRRVARLSKKVAGLQKAS